MVQISHAGSRDEILRATANAIRTSIEEYPGKEPLASICFPGASRKQLLGTRIEEEYLLFKNNYPHIPVTGFYTYGEFAPSSKNQKAQFHNQLFVNLVLGVK